MTETIDRAGYEALMLSGERCAQAREDAQAVRSGDREAAKAIAASAMHIAAVAPEGLVDFYDALCEGWFGKRPNAPSVSAPSAPGRLEQDFLDGLWELVNDDEAGRDPAAITVRSAGLTALLPFEIHGRLAAMAKNYPGVLDAASSGLPERFLLEDLARCPKDSLGGHLHSMVVDQGFDLEVLDRDALGLAGLPDPLAYLNIRILQCHDVWHEVAGYETTGLHEVAISGFQMGQFGHHYSSFFVAMIFAKGAFASPIEGVTLTLDTVLSAYMHGRETPPMLGVVWEDIWDQPISQIRESQGIQAYDSPYPPSLLEDLANA